MIILYGASFIKHSATEFSLDVIAEETNIIHNLI